MNYKEPVKADIKPEDIIFHQEINIIDLVGRRMNFSIACVEPVDEIVIEKEKEND